MTSGRIPGTSATRCRIGSGSSLRQVMPACSGSSRPVGTRRRPASKPGRGQGPRVCCSCSGLRPPRAAPERGRGGRRLTCKGSGEGGFEESDESRRSRASRSAIRRSRDWTRASTAAWTSAGALSQRSAGIGKVELMLPVYRPEAECASPYHRERLRHPLFGGLEVEPLLLTGQVLEPASTNGNRHRCRLGHGARQPATSTQNRAGCPIATQGGPVVARPSHTWILRQGRLGQRDPSVPDSKVRPVLPNLVSVHQENGRSRPVSNLDDQPNRSIAVSASAASRSA